MSPLYKTISSKDIPLDAETTEKLCLYLEENHAPVQRPRFLGSGSFGYAFKINSEKAVKITSDDKEAWVAEFLRQQKLPATSPLVRIFDVVELYNTDGEPIYAIVEELLSKAPKKWKTLATSLLAYDERQEPDYDDGSFYFGQKTLDELDDEDLPADEEKWVTKFLKTLIKLDIKYMDLHEGNILMRGDYPVAIDINNGKEEQKIKLL